MHQHRNFSASSDKNGCCYETLGNLLLIFWGRTVNIRIISNWGVELKVNKEEGRFTIHLVNEIEIDYLILFGSVFLI